MPVEVYGEGLLSLSENEIAWQEIISRNKTLGIKT
jgi:hypothetical protein